MPLNPAARRYPDSFDIRRKEGGRAASVATGEAGETINCPLITPGQRHIMDPDSFMTIYGTFRRGDRPALGFRAPGSPRPPAPPSLFSTRGAAGRGRRRRRLTAGRSAYVTFYTAGGF
ncbi:unnamed protein product, partial [Iphiclides podalirius]